MKAKLLKLRHFVNDAVAFFLYLVDLIFLVSILMIVFGWVGYVAIEGTGVIAAIQKHILVIAALISPFESPSVIENVFATIDLISAWLFLPTVLSIILTRAQEITQKWEEVWLGAYEGAYNAYMQLKPDMNQTLATEKARKAADEYVAVAKKRLRSSGIAKKVAHTEERAARPGEASESHETTTS